MFVHDAIDELIRCGETDIAAGDIRIAIATLSKRTAGGLTSFQKEFEVRLYITETVASYNKTQVYCTSSQS